MADYNYCGESTITQLLLKVKEKLDEQSGAGGDTGGETSGGGLPPLRIYAVKNVNGNYYQEIVEGGATQKYTAAEIHELTKQCVVTLEVWSSLATDAKKGHFTYISSDIADDGTVNSVTFSGYYDDYLSTPILAYATLYPERNIVVSSRKWSTSSVRVDPTLKENGVPADAYNVGYKLTELKNQIANSGGESINVAAEVGQTIVVKEVDANGKPTAWEAANYQPRTHWTEMVEFLPETTIEVDPDNGEGALLVDFVLEAGKPYTIKYNGVEYADCVGFAQNGVLYFGNLSAMDESLPATDHPFILASGGADMDGDGNIDYQIAIMPLDGSTSVALTILDETIHKMDTKYVPDSVPHVETHGDVILSDYVLTNSEEGAFVITEPMGIVTIGSRYEVKVGNQTYQCTAKELTDSSGIVYAELFDANRSVLIFLYRHVSEVVAAGTYGHMTNGAIEGETLSISAAYTAHKIDNRCMPPSFFIVPVQRAGNSTDGYTYTSNYTYAEVRSRIETNGDVPVLCVSNTLDYQTGTFYVYHISFVASDMIVFFYRDASTSKYLYWRYNVITDTL